MWRSLKYECVYLSEFATGSQARTGIGGWMDFYDRCRPHSSLNDRTPDEAYTNDGADTSPGPMAGLFRILTVVDQWSRHSPLLEVAARQSGQSVGEALDRVSGGHRHRARSPSIMAPSFNHVPSKIGRIAAASNSTSFGRANPSKTHSLNRLTGAYETNV